jgi:hypothetical protein
MSNNDDAWIFTIMPAGIYIYMSWLGMMRLGFTCHWSILRRISARQQDCILCIFAADFDVFFLSSSFFYLSLVL